MRPLVLVVDVDARSAVGLARLLRADGYEVEITMDGATALGRLTQMPTPDALVTAFYLPHVDGLTLGRYARTRRAQIPVFIVSSHANTPNGGVVDPDEQPPISVVLKPVDYASLANRLGAALGLHPRA